MRRIGGTSTSPWRPLAIILAVLLLASLVAFAMVATEPTDLSFSLF